jgi:hypothetical protein
MDTTKIIAELDNEIANLTYVRALLAGHSSRTAPKRRTLSAEARKRIADAQRRRWAKARKLKRPGNT